MDFALKNMLRNCNIMKMKNSHFNIPTEAEIIVNNIFIFEVQQNFME